ncbi:MAG: DNA polymerase III subunit delta [Rhodospirillales bacterium]|nr:DNA polymerase III subunit delta [Rhodospirillales bacterium]
MKITGARQDSFIRAPDPAMACVLLYGPDRGLISERALTLTKTVVDAPDDPFRVVEMTGAGLKTDPARLLDEAQAMAFGGGRRLIRLRDVSDAASKILSEYLGIAATSDALVIVEAAELGPRSSLRKLCEGAKNAASIACYGDNSGSLARVIGETLGAHSLKPSRDALAYLTGSLGSDRSVTRGELEKLALYMGGPGTVELADAQAAIGDSAATALDDISLSAGSGDRAGLDKALTRALGEGSHPVQILRAVARHFLRLHLAAGLVAGGKNPDQAMKSLKPPVMFMQADRFRVQLQRWRPAHLSDALDILNDAEMDCKTTGMPVDAVCGRALMRIAQAARR